MHADLKPTDNYERTRELVGYVSRDAATRATYQALGFKSGLEIHQQLDTTRKMFCNCPAGLYQRDGDFDSEIVRHMRPTLSEMGEYDGTALMERKTKKNIIYRLKNESACTYDIDDTPPFPLNREALEMSLKIALMLNLNIVGELHITRKQYLDGSIPTGFQRTAIIGIEGDIQLRNGKVRIIQMSIEEDSCREVSDEGHWRVYTTDRLGMPLIETVTYPDMKTPAEVAEAAQYLRFLVRSSGKVRTGIGAARQDVNVSIDGGTRVEIKGVAHISWIPSLVHNEAFRQKALLQIANILAERIRDKAGWKTTHVDLDYNGLSSVYPPISQAKKNRNRIVAVKLPRFGGILSFFTQPGKSFADELSDRLKVIACIEKPNLLHSEQLRPILSGDNVSTMDRLLKLTEGDAWVITWGESTDVDTAIETIEERCQLAFEGVPNETRKSFADGSTVFERVLPGADRMYPDTDSPPIPIGQELIDEQDKNLAPSIDNRLKQFDQWGIPGDTYNYLLKRNLADIVERVITNFNYDPTFIGSLLGHSLKHFEGVLSPASDFAYERIYDLVAFVDRHKLEKQILRRMLPVVYQHPNMALDSVLTTIDYRPLQVEEIVSLIAPLHLKFANIRTSSVDGAETRWIMGQLRRPALGNMPLSDLKARVEKEIAHE